MRDTLDFILNLDFGTTFDKASKVQLFRALCKFVNSKANHRDNNLNESSKQVYYISAEFLVGKMLHANLLNLGYLNQAKEVLALKELSFSDFEDIEDMALGNGGLGRLAACFLDSGASIGINLHGYGIKYRYGLFKQNLSNGFQEEEPDVWKNGEDCLIKKDEIVYKIEFKNYKINAIAYDMPVIGYKNNKVNTLRLFDAEPIEEFDMVAFNNTKYMHAYKNQNQAKRLTALLYPNDNLQKGKDLRLEQEYFLCSASVQDILYNFEKQNSDYSKLPEFCAVQLNDTHPALSTIELIRILTTDKRLSFNEALSIAKKTFAYTNHTIMSEALEKWDLKVIKRILPKIYKILIDVDKSLQLDLKESNLTHDEAQKCRIIDEHQAHMANLSCYVSKAINGVAEVHSQILKDSTLKEFYKLYPNKFQNKTNGITPRRWLNLCNDELTEMITSYIGDGFITDLDKLKKLKPLIGEKMQEKFLEIKEEKKKQLCEYVYKKEGIEISEHFIFNIQIKRLHEYKRQLLNAFSILYIYNGLKDGSIKEFPSTLFLFGAKSAPGYKRAKGIIRYIRQIQDKVNNDSETNDRLKVIFVNNYNVSYAEKLIPAADISEQISMAGTEASGTGNMKFMLNGAVTLGVMDGANIEIFEQAGEENNYVFGARVDQIEDIKANYDPNKILASDKKLNDVVASLISGEFDDSGTGEFKELYESLTKGASWHEPDNYLLIYDFADYIATKLRCIQETADSKLYSYKALQNIASAGKFSSDRTIKEYYTDIWIK